MRPTWPACPIALALMVVDAALPFESQFAHAMWLKTWSRCRSRGARRWNCCIAHDAACIESAECRLAALDRAAAGGCGRCADARARAQAVAGCAHRHTPGCRWPSALRSRAQCRGASALASAAGGAVPADWLAATVRHRSVVRVLASTSCATNTPRKSCPRATPPRELAAHAHRADVRANVSPDGVPLKVRQAIEHELALIARLRFEPYFLTVADVVQLGTRAEDPVPGPRQRGQLHRLLLPGCHRGRPRSHDAAVRAFRQRRAQRAARHRRRLRAPAPRGGDPVHLPQVRSPSRGAHRGGDQLPAALGAARHGPRDGHRSRSHRRSGATASIGSTAAASTPIGCARTASTPTRRSASCGSS